jgi:hypothetical protein
MPPRINATFHAIGGIRATFMTVDARPSNDALGAKIPEVSDSLSGIDRRGLFVSHLPGVLGWGSRPGHASRRPAARFGG